MARIVYTIGELMGSVGGLTFQRNRSGKIVRFRPTVGKKSTNAQQTAHAKHLTFLRGWQLLTLAQKVSWNAYAITWLKTNKFGEDKQLTGQNWYESINFMRSLLGLSELTDPPAHLLPIAPPSFELIVTPDKLYIHFTFLHDYTDSPVIVWTSTPSRRVTNSINQIRKYAMIITVDPGDILDITTQWENATGITWNPEQIFPNTNIFVCLESVNAASGISSAMLCSNISTAETTADNSELIFYS